MLRKKARRLARVGALVVATGFRSGVFFSLTWWNATPWPHEPTWWEKGASVPLFVISMVCLKEGRQIVHSAYKHMRAAAPASTPPRDALFVLYLRGFGEDAARTSRNR